MRLLKKEDNSYSTNLGVDDIEDLIQSGYDWTQDDFKYPTEPEHDYDDLSKLITISKAEKVIGKRPDLKKPVAPKSAKARPETIEKFKKALADYEKDIELREAWNEKYEKLADMTQQLKNTSDQLSDLINEVEAWCSSNPGTFIIRNSAHTYSLLRDPAIIYNDIQRKLRVPTDITSLQDRLTWVVDSIDYDEDNDIFPSILITINGKNTLVYRIISVPDDIHYISTIIEDYMDGVQPKNIPEITKAKLDTKTQRVVDQWVKNGTTNSQMSEEEKDVKLFIASLSLAKEAQTMFDYPMPTPVSKLMDKFLSQI